VIYCKTLSYRSYRNHEMCFIITQPGILSVLPRLKEAMVNLGKNKEIVPLSGFEMVAYRIQVSNMIVTAFDFFLPSSLYIFV